MKDDLLGGRLHHLETRCRFHRCDGILTGVQMLSLLMEPDFTIRIGKKLAKINGSGCIGCLSVTGIGHMEAGSLDGGTSNTILFVNGEFRGFAVLENDFFLIPCIERNRLYPICILIRKEVGGWYR